MLSRERAKNQQHKKDENRRVKQNLQTPKIGKKTKVQIRRQAVGADLKELSLSRNERCRA